jgi:hypothetical protein
VRARALLPLFAMAALLLGGCGSDSGDTGSARDVLKQATQHPAKSADMRLAMNLKLDGVPQLNGPLKATISGPTRSNGAHKLPDFDWRIRYQGAGKQGSVRLIATGGDVWVGYGGETYEVGKQLVNRFMSQAQKGQQPKLRLAVPDWLKDASVEDETGGGKKVTGQLDVSKAITDVNKLTAQLPQGHQIPKSSIKKVDDSVKNAALEFHVGADHILRRSLVNLKFVLPQDLQAQARGLKGGSLRVETDQANVNGNQHVTAPANARPLGELLQRLGLPAGAIAGA